MVLNSSGPISFSDIQSEFGGGNPISLSEYYHNASGKHAVGVPGIPNKGRAIALNQFQSKKKSVLKTVTLQTGTFNASGAYGNQREYNAPVIKLPSDYKRIKSWDVTAHYQKNRTSNVLSKFSFGFKNSSGRTLQGITINGAEANGYGGYTARTGSFKRTFEIGSANSTIHFYFNFYGYANLTNCYCIMKLEYYA